MSRLRTLPGVYSSDVLGVVGALVHRQQQHASQSSRVTNALVAVLSPLHRIRMEKAKPYATASVRIP